MSENKHSNRPDDLEQELAQFRPAPVPARLRDRIALQAAAAVRPRFRLPPAWAALGALAASLAIVALIWRLETHRRSHPVAAHNDVQIARAPKAPLPTVAEFHQVIARSPEAIDAFLDRQNQSRSRAAAGIVFRAFDRID